MISHRESLGLGHVIGAFAPFFGRCGGPAAGCGACTGAGWSAVTPTTVTLLTAGSCLRPVRSWARCTRGQEPDALKFRGDRAQVAFSARLEHILVHGRDNLPDRGRSGVGAATVHKTERSSQLNENGSLLRQKRRSTRLVPADAGMAPTPPSSWGRS